MKVSEFKYERVTLEQMQAVYESAIEKILNASSAQEVLDARESILPALGDYSTAANLAYMRYSINTADEFYVAEMNYYDEVGPAVQELGSRYVKAMLASPFRAELEKALSPVLFKQYEVEAKSMSPEIVEDMVEENKLVTEYSQFMAGLEFEFRGEKMPRSLLAKYFKDDDRETRREAYEELGRVLQANHETLDRIYDDMVHVRDRMAKKLGFDNYIDLGYLRMNRLCYDKNDVAVFRENILRDIVPVVARLKKENAKRLGIEDFKLYDNDVTIPGGDPKPAGKEEIFAAAKEMYHSMSRETGDFIDMMLDADAFDVDSRKNKWGGGYCTGFYNFKQPFILANFNGTAGDVDVVTHEAGHAFADYMTSSNRFALEINVGGMETAETHSMSMEFFAWPYMDKFFGENADKYRFMHAFDAFAFIPYGIVVDAFQHEVYEHPDMTPAERNAAWNALEAKFRPWMSTEGMTYLEQGTRWQYQMHIYESPFYYIDYVIAQTTAFRFLLASRRDYADAFARYVRLLRQGGEKLYTDLLTEAGFPSPFTDGALKDFARELEEMFEEIRV